MKHLAQGLSRYLRIQARFCGWSLILLGIVMTVLILLQVFFRFVVYVPLPWSEECARYLMIWMGMLGSVLALEKGRHIGVTVFMERLPAPVGDRAEVLVSLLIMAFFGMMLWQGIELCRLNAGQQSPALEISMLVPYLALPVGFGMMLLVLLGDLLRPFTDGGRIEAGTP